MRTLCWSCFMLLDCRLLCKGLGLDLLWFHWCDFMNECFVSVPLSAKNSREMESANINQRLASSTTETFDRIPLNRASKYFWSYTDLFKGEGWLSLSPTLLPKCLLFHCITLGRGNDPPKKSLGPLSHTLPTMSVKVDHILGRKSFLVFLLMSSSCSWIGCEGTKRVLVFTALV